MHDGMIVELYWNRDQRAIAETADKYGAYCDTVAGNILHDSRDREECVNDTWLRAWNSIPPQRPGNLRMFLAKIVRNLAFDRYRAQRAQKRDSQMEAVLEELEGCLSENTNPENEILARELSRAINRFVRELPVRDGNVFVRRYFFAESAADIGKRYGIAAGNVAVILTRIRKKLRLYLEKGGFV